MTTLQPVTRLTCPEASLVWPFLSIRFVGKIKIKINKWTLTSDRICPVVHLSMSYDRPDLPKDDDDDYILFGHIIIRIIFQRHPGST